MLSWWHKGLGKSRPWIDKRLDYIVDWNELGMEELRRSLGEVAEGKTDQQVADLANDKQALLHERQLLSPTPWADLQYIDGKLRVQSYNPAFAQDLREKLGDLTTEEMSDDDVVKLYVDRENIELEEPRLEVIHEGIEADGQLKIQLDWNSAFIRHLAKHGITGETEDEAIEAYLSRLMTRVNDEQGEPEDIERRELLEQAFQDITVVADRELEEAKKQVKKEPKKGKR